MENNSQEQTLSESEKALRAFQGQIKHHIGNFYINIGKTILETPYIPNFENFLFNQSLYAPDLFKASNGTQSAPSQKRVLISLDKNSAEDPFADLNLTDEQVIHKKSNKISTKPKPNSTPMFEVDLREVFHEELSLEEALEKLNIEASELGYKFRVGPSTKTRGYYSFYCKYGRKTKQDSNSKGDEDNRCGAFFRFRTLKGKLQLRTFNLMHNHPGVDFHELTDAMKKDLEFVSRRTKIIDVVSFLESKHRTNLSYQQVYYTFRKIKPLFTKNDCHHFISYLEKEGFQVSFEVNEEDQDLCKLFFASKTMQANYKDFGDIMEIDTTYNTNIYSIPLVVFTGIARNGKNLLFGLALINDEKFETMKWVLESFLSCHQQKNPTLIVSDGDLALCKAIQIVFEDSKHLLCQWHIARNLRRNFSYLKKKNQKEYDIALSLPYCLDVAAFEEKCSILVKFFESQDKNNDRYKKSIDYLKELCSYKEKWCDACKPLIFSAGSHTTSRAESMNALIKRFVNQRSELSDCIDLIELLDDSDAFSAPVIKLTKKQTTQYNLEPILESLKEKVGEIIFNKHFDQFIQHSRYAVKIIEEKEELTIVSVTSQDNNNMQKNSTKERIVECRNGEIPSCSCREYFRDGIICRHLFAVMKLFQVKDVSNYIHKRWLIQEATTYATHQFDENWKKAIKVADKFREEKEQKEMEDKLNFSKTVKSLKTLKQSKENRESEEEEEEEEEEDEEDEEIEKEEEEKGFESFQSEDEENITEISTSKDQGKKKKLRVSNFEKKTNNKGRPRETESSAEKANSKANKRRKAPEGERIENPNQKKKSK